MKSTKYANKALSVSIITWKWCNKMSTILGRHTAIITFLIEFKLLFSTYQGANPDYKNSHFLSYFLKVKA